MITIENLAFVPLMFVLWHIGAYWTAYLVASGWNHGLYYSIDSINKGRTLDKLHDRKSQALPFKPKGERE